MSTTLDQTIQRFDIRIRDEEWIEVRGIALSADTPTTPSVVRTPRDEQLIVPGERIGAVRLGMTRAELEAKLGKADRVDVAGEQYNDLGITVTLTEGRVSRIGNGRSRHERSASQRFTAITRNLIGLGSDVSLVTTTFAEGDSQRSIEVQPLRAYCYRRNGIEFIARDDEVIEIAIFPATPQGRSRGDR